jgi:hypothetical protein
MSQAQGGHITHAHSSAAEQVATILLVRTFAHRGGARLIVTSMETNPVKQTTSGIFFDTMSDQSAEMTEKFIEFPQSKLASFSNELNTSQSPPEVSMSCCWEKNPHHAAYQIVLTKHSNRRLQLTITSRRRH